jgi:hypothetical protein
MEPRVVGLRLRSHVPEGGSNYLSPDSRIRSEFVIVTIQQEETYE